MLLVSMVFFFVVMEFDFVKCFVLNFVKFFNFIIFICWVVGMGEGRLSKFLKLFLLN